VHNSCLEACQGETSQAELLMLMRIAEFFVVLQLLTKTKKGGRKKKDPYFCLIPYDEKYWGYGRVMCMASPIHSFTARQNCLRTRPKANLHQQSSGHLCCCCKA
jgi:hypothetical protein